MLCLILIPSRILKNLSFSLSRWRYHMKSECSHTKKYFYRKETMDTENCTTPTFGLMHCQEGGHPYNQYLRQDLQLGHLESPRSSIRSISTTDPSLPTILTHLQIISLCFLLLLPRCVPPNITIQSCFKKKVLMLSFKALLIYRSFFSPCSPSDEEQAHCPAAPPSRDLTDGTRMVNFSKSLSPLRFLHAGS